MIKLLIHSPAPAEVSAQTCFGGLPVLPEGEPFSWPICSTCDGAMKFFGRIRTGDAEQKLVLLFVCENDPGMCDEWDANAGGNAALMVQASSLHQVERPENEDLFAPIRYGAEVIKVDAPDYDAAREIWASQTGRPLRQALGHVSDSPQWLQGDETPNCACCNEPMQFLAQLEQGPDRETEMNFGGGGVAYTFICAAGKPSAKFLWQC